MTGGFLKEHRWNMYRISRLHKSYIKRNIKRNMEKMLKENKSKHEHELLDQNIAYEMILMDKEREQEIMKEQMIETKKESAVAQQTALRRKKEKLSNIVEFMEVKLQCSICREFLIQSTGLNCSHVFCKLCIKQWMKVKKICPNCRTPITSHIQIPALDCCIGQMVEQLGDEVKKQRADILKQRKSEQDESDRSEPGFLNVLNSFIKARGGDVEMAAVLRRVAGHTRSLVRMGVAAFRRTAVHTNSFARTGAATFRRTTAAFTERETRVQSLTTSAVLRRAVALALTTVCSGAEGLSKSAVFRKAAALTRAIALAGAQTLKRSKLLERVAALAIATALKGTEYVKKSETVQRVAGLTRTVVEAISKHPTLRKTMMISRAAITKGTKFKRVHIIKSLRHIKMTAIRKAAKAQRIAKRFRAMAASRLAALRNARVYTRTSAKIITKTQRPRSISQAEAVSQTERQDASNSEDNSPYRSWNLQVSFIIGAQ